MFIRVKYGDNETLLCNPSCTVINLLTNIKTRSKQDKQTIVDLTDETGIVQELDLHRYDCATKHLTALGTYVLVKKQPISPGLDHDDDSTETTYEYTPLLNDCHRLLPGYRIHQTAGGPGEPGRKRPDDHRRKSVNPSGAKTSRSSRQAKDRSPSKKTPKS